MFRKNVAGQFIHFQGVDATTGGIKTGVSWTIRRCIDGTFAAGGGTVTEDGTTGWYKYAMSQADTNGNDIAFNFTGTGAVPQTVNIVTTAADPSDAVRLGLTALPNAAAEAAGGLFTRGAGAGQINQQTNGQIDANIERVRNSALNALVSGRMDSSVGAMANAVITAAAHASGAIDANAIATDAIGAAELAADAVAEIQSGLSTLTQANVRSAVGLASANLDTQLSGINSKTTNLPASPAATGDPMTLTAGERAAVADKLLGRSRAGGADGGRTVASCLAFGRNKWAISAGVLTVYDDDDTTPLYTAAVVTQAGDPVTSVDPA